MTTPTDLTRDAFGRLRVSEAVTLFDHQSQYDAGAMFWETQLTANGTAAHRPAEASVRLSITDDASSKAVRQTKEYFRYQPGKSQFVLTTFCMGPPVAGATKEVGYGDGENGIFLREVGGAVSMVLRSKATGSVVETVVQEADWNGETSIGSGVEKLTIDFTKTQIFGVDLEWLGVGRVRTFFVIDGNIYFAHVFDNANLNPTVYMTTANLPLRYSIEGAPAASAAYIDAICATVMSEGGFERGRGAPFSANMGATPLAVTTRRPILSIRPKLTFNSITNRAVPLLQGALVMAATAPALIELVYSGTLTSPSFASVDPDSIMESDVAATAISDGIVLESYYVAASQGASSSPGITQLGALGRLPLTVNMDGDDRELLSIVATGVGTPSLSASINWHEQR